jgi:hypothetical protein
MVRERVPLRNADEGRIAQIAEILRLEERIVSRPSRREVLKQAASGFTKGDCRSVI